MNVRILPDYAFAMMAYASCRSNIKWQSSYNAWR